MHVIEKVAIRRTLWGNRVKGGKVLQRWRGSGGNVRLSTDEFLVENCFNGQHFR